MVMRFLLDTVEYTYYPTGDRETTTYTTQNGTRKWGYADYVRIGNPEQGGRAFQTMVQLDSSGDPTPNEFHYAYDQSGRLVEAAFAQTPNLTQPSNGSYYTADDPADTRARVVYNFDSGGRCAGVFDYWEEWAYDPPGGAFTSEKLLKQEYGYDAKGQRSAQSFSHGASGSWVADRTETYAYDAQRGFLTDVDYDDGLAGETPSWTYDLAGNRSTTGQTGGVFDNLNRLVSGGGSTYLSDLLGNRTWRNYGVAGVQRYVYDELNRASSICGATAGAAYEYRADGMRVQKVSGLTIAWNPGDEESASGWYDDNWAVNKATTRYYYDGQMCMEEDFAPQMGSQSSSYKIRYGLGARGIDYVEKTQGSTTTKAYPLYDGHGNMIATISLAGTISNQRAYDAWGGVRAESGIDSTNPDGRYCANLGHKQDDESGLIYMRARYCDPATGRFITEDPARDGANWFVYCNNNPVTLKDLSGKEPDDDSFDPVYWFDWRKWYTLYTFNVALTPGLLLLALSKGQLGIIAFILLTGAKTGYIGAAIVLMYELRIVAWMGFLFDGEGDAWRDIVPFGFNHFFGE